MDLEDLVSFDPDKHDIGNRKSHWFYMLLVYGLVVALFGFILLPFTSLFGTEMSSETRNILIYLFLFQFLLLLVVARTTYWALIVLPSKIEDMADDVSETD